MDDSSLYSVLTRAECDIQAVQFGLMATDDAISMKLSKLQKCAIALSSPFFNDNSRWVIIETILGDPN